MTDMLLQHGSGVFAEMLGISSEQHGAYANEFGLDFVSTHDAVDCEDRYRAWEKMAVLRSICRERPDGTQIFMLDADAWIRKLKDFRPVFKLSALNPIAVFGEKSWSNTGTLGIFNCELSRTILRSVWNACDNETAGVDLYFHQTIKKMNVSYTLLPEAWNYFPYYGDAQRDTKISEEDAIVKAWHGFTEKKVLRKMQQERELLKVA